MKIKNITKAAIILVLMNGLIQSFSQNISVTFTGIGAATQVDSVTATNMTTNESVTLPGNETLILAANTGILTDSELANIGIVYPNPFSRTALLSISIKQPQTVKVQIQNLVGQIVAHTQDYLQLGEHEFALTVNAAGIYWVSLTSEQGTNSYKVICMEASDAEIQIDYRGIGYHIPQPSDFKGSQTGYTLGYRSGDICHYKCKSGIYTTIFMDSPTFSKNYEAEFVACTDPDGKSYSSVKIGNQTWMAENLASLPMVFPSKTIPLLDPMYYVYGYEGTSVNAAKATTNYHKYGVLYNWESAKTACPDGWHLPSYDEWRILTDYLENNGFYFGDRTWYIAKSLSSRFDWNPSLVTGRVGKDQSTNNKSGFNAFPGGNLESAGLYFVGINQSTVFWSASKGQGSSYAICYSLYFDAPDFGLGEAPKNTGASVRCIID